MTGRRLYEKYTDAAAHVGCYEWARSKTKLAHPDDPPLAWGFLLPRDREVWNDLARRITPRRRSRA